jgi:hypothetical protein
VRRRLSPGEHPLNRGSVVHRGVTADLREFVAARRGQGRTAPDGMRGRYLPIRSPAAASAFASTAASNGPRPQAPPG